MKSIVWIIVAGIAVLATAACAQSDSADTATASNDIWANQPGFKPVLFAPGLISTPDHNERDITFSPDSKVLYFTRDARIMVTHLTDTGWSEPVRASFSADYPEFEAFVNRDGGRLYYITSRPLSGEGEPEDYQIWFVDKDTTGWGTPQRFNEEGDFYPTITDNDIMYFTGADNNLYFSRLIDGRMAGRQRMSDSINTASAEYNAFVPPDGSYIIFTSFGWGDGFGGGDLFISFKTKDGAWTPAKNMGGGINTNGHDYCPSLSRDGRWFFYTSNIGGSEDIYWVDAGLIDYLKTHDLNTADMLYSTITEKGLEQGLVQYEAFKLRFADYCVFDGRLLAGVADRLIIAEKIEEGVSLMRESFAMYPESRSIIQRLKLAALANQQDTLSAIAEELRSTESVLNRGLENRINRLGYRLLGWNRIDAARRIMLLNTELFPESFNVFDSYAEALMFSGDTASAIINYEKSLELNPDNNNAVEQLRLLNGE
ncbi:MAG: hypothetical protein AB1483_02460 [Candidatus Zixiibacteriota bacterium]